MLARAVCRKRELFPAVLADFWSAGEL